MANGSLALGGAGASGGSFSLDGAKDKLGEFKDKARDYVSSLRDSLTPTFLRENEAAAAENTAAGDDGESLGEKEKNVIADSADKIKNNVKGIAAGAAALKSGDYIKAANRFKKAGPIGGIIAGVILFAMMAYMGNSLAPFSLVNVFQNDDPLNITSQRTDNLMRRMMAPASRKQVVNIDGTDYDIKTLSKARLFQPDKFQLSLSQKSQLKKKGFEIDEIDGITVLKKGGKTIVPDSRYVDKFGGGGDIVDYKTAMGGNDDLALSLKEGSLTFRSRVKYWFDTKLKNLFARIGLSRNRGRNLETGDSDEVKNRFAEDGEDADMSKGRISDEVEFSQDEDAPGGFRRAIDTGGELDLNGIKKGATPEVIESKLYAAADSKVGNKLKGALSQAAMWGCFASNIVGSVMNVMRALNLMQVQSTALGIFENIQRAQAGDNVGDLLNTTASMLMTPGTNTYKTGFFSSGSLEGTSKQDMDTIEVSGTVFDASSIKSKYEGRPRAPDESTGALSPYANIGGLAPLLQKFGLSMTSFKTCASLQIITSLTSLAEELRDVADIVACFSPAAAAGCTDLFINVGTKIGIAVTTQLIITGLVSFLVPKVANWLVLDITTQLFGQQLGNVIGEGIADIINKNAQASASSLATAVTLRQFRVVERIAIEENAQYERATRSPFDPTSQYTFLGSLVTKLSSMSSSLLAPFSSLISLGNTAMSSLGSLLPGAAAISDAEYVDYLQEYTRQYCANLDGIGALAADAFCNPKFIEDISTIDADPAEVYLRLEKMGCFEDKEGDNPEIKLDSKCMKFIVYYTQRESEFGVADMNIANDGALFSSNQVVSSVVSSTPAFGEMVDIANSSKSLANLGYITGEVGVTQNDGKSLSLEIRGNEVNPAGGVSSWDEVKYIQRYISDQRILESMGLILESSVSVALRKYYEQHPLDNSFEGILARKTGMTKENVEIALDFIKLASFAANYEPANYAPYAETEEERQAISFDDGRLDLMTEYKNVDVSVAVVRREYLIA